MENKHFANAIGEGRKIPRGDMDPAREVVVYPVETGFVVSFTSEEGVAFVGEIRHDSDNPGRGIYIFGVEGDEPIHVQDDVPMQDLFLGTAFMRDLGWEF